MALAKKDLQAIRNITEEVATQKQEELAIMFSRSFDQVDIRFNIVDKKFDAIDEVLSDHTHRLTRIERKQDANQWLLDKHDTRIAHIEKQTDLLPKTAR